MLRGLHCLFKRCRICFLLHIDIFTEFYHMVFLHASKNFQTQYSVCPTRNPNPPHSPLPSVYNPSSKMSHLDISSVLQVLGFYLLTKYKLGYVLHFYGIPYCCLFFAAPNFRYFRFITWFCPVSFKTISMGN